MGLAGWAPSPRDFSARAPEHIRPLQAELRLGPPRRTCHAEGFLAARAVVEHLGPGEGREAHERPRKIRQLGETRLHGVATSGAGWSH